LNLLKELPFVEIEAEGERTVGRAVREGKGSLADLFGLWENRDITLNEIRKKAWKNIISDCGFRISERTRKKSISEFGFRKKKGSLKVHNSKLKADPRRRIGFDEVQEIWSHPYYVDCRSDDPEQFRAIGWVKGKLVSVIYEVREDDQGVYYHLVTLWKSTKQEEKLYEEYS